MGFISLIFVLIALYFANIADKSFQKLKKSVEDLQCRLDVAEARISNILETLREEQNDKMGR